MYCRIMARIEDLRIRLGWTQPQMARYLGQSQANVSRMKSGQKESGSVSRLLDLLEAGLANGTQPAKAEEVSS